MTATRRTALVLAIVLLMVGCGRTSPPSSAEAPSAVPASGLPAEALWNWSTITPATAQKGVGLDTVAIGPQGLAATSSRGDQILWTSEDGTAWRWTPAPALISSIILDVGSGPDGDFVATGFLPDHEGLLVRFDAASVTVTKVGTRETFVASIESTDASLVAAGGTFDGTTEIAGTWRLTEAGAWDSVVGPEDAVFGPLCVSRSGWIAASNAGAPEQGNGRADLWLSADGRQWQLGASLKDARVNSIVATDDGFVAAGAVGSAARDFHPAMWHSTDGRSWDRIERNQITGTMSAVVRWRDGFVAAGSSIQAPAGGLIWTSRDGVTWSDVEGVSLKGMRLEDAAASASQLVIVGEKDGESLVLLAGLPD